MLNLEAPRLVREDILLLGVSRVALATCGHCGAGYTRRVWWQRWCGTPCRIGAYWARRLARKAGGEIAPPGAAEAERE